MCVSWLCDVYNANKLYNVLRKVLPLLQQVLGHLDLLRRSGDGDNAIGRAGQRLVDRDERIRLHANLPDALPRFADDRSGQLENTETIFTL